MKKRLIIVSLFLLAVASACPYAAGSVASVSLLFATNQKDSPIKISSLTSSPEFLCERVELKNVSGKTVVSVTLGAMLYALDNQVSQPSLVSGRAVPTDVKPGQQLTIKPYLLPPSVANQKGAILRSVRLQAVFGVLQVNFADGSSWSCDPEAYGGFEPGQSPQPMAGRSPSCGRAPFWVEKADLTSPQGYFTCEHVDYNLICQNAFSYCTDKECPNPNNCPKQNCFYHSAPSQ